MYMKNKEVISIIAAKTMKEPISPLSLRKYTGLVVFGEEGTRSDLDHPQPEDGGLLRPQSSYSFPAYLRLGGDKDFTKSPALSDHRT